MRDSIPQEIYNILTKEWPLKRNSQKVIQFCYHYFINYSHKQDTSDYYVLLHHIKEFINSSHFESKFKYQKTSILGGELSYVTVSYDFKELNERLDKALNNLSVFSRPQTLFSSFSFSTSFSVSLSLTMQVLMLIGGAMAIAGKEHHLSQQSAASDSLTLSLKEHSSSDRLNPYQTAVPHVYYLEEAATLFEISIYQAVANDFPLKTLEKILEEEKNSGGNRINMPEPVNLNTALHTASFRQQHEVRKMLLKYGADPNAQNRQGMTCLHQAATEGDKEWAELLLQHGAKTDLIFHKDPYYYTPAQLALAGHHLDVAKLIMENGKKKNGKNYSISNHLLEMVYVAESKLVHKEYQDALDSYRQVEKILPSLEEEYADFVGEIYASMLTIYVHQQDYVIAVKYAELAVKYSLPRPPIYGALVSIHFQLENYSEALDYVNQGLSYFPDDADLLKFKVMLEPYKAESKVNKKIDEPELNNAFFDVTNFLKIGLAFIAIGIAALRVYMHLSFEKIIWGEQKQLRLQFLLNQLTKDFYLDSWIRDGNRLVLDLSQPILQQGEVLTTKKILKDAFIGALGNTHFKQEANKLSILASRFRPDFSEVVTEEEINGFCRRIHKEIDLKTKEYNEKLAKKKLNLSSNSEQVSKKLEDIKGKLAEFDKYLTKNQSELEGLNKVVKEYELKKQKNVEEFALDSKSLDEKICEYRKAVEAYEEFDSGIRTEIEQAKFLALGQEMGLEKKLNSLEEFCRDFEDRVERAMQNSLECFEKTSRAFEELIKKSEELISEEEEN